MFCDRNRREADSLLYGVIIKWGKTVCLSNNIQKNQGKDPTEGNTLVGVKGDIKGREEDRGGQLESVEEEVCCLVVEEKDEQEKDWVEIV